MWSCTYSLNIYETILTLYCHSLRLYLAAYRCHLQYMYILQMLYGFAIPLGIFLICTLVCTYMVYSWPCCCPLYGLNLFVEICSTSIPRTILLYWNSIWTQSKSQSILSFITKFTKALIGFRCIELPHISTE